MKFLLQMHKVYWSNISRAEDACWKMMAAYTALIAGLTFSVPFIGYSGFLGVFIPFSFMSVIISLNANLWFLRNISLISNLEKEFLSDKDYNYLIPRRWAQKYPFLNSEPWWVFVSVYFSVCVIITFFIIFPKINCTERKFAISLFLIFSFFTIFYGWWMWRRYKRFKAEAPGKQLS